MGGQWGRNPGPKYFQVLELYVITWLTVSSLLWLNPCHCLDSILFPAQDTKKSCLHWTFSQATICTQWQSDLMEKVVCPFCSEVESKGGWWAYSRCTWFPLIASGWYFFFLHSSCLQMSLNKDTELQFLPMANGSLPQLSVCLCEMQSIYHTVCVPSQMGCNSNWLIWGFAESSSIDVPVQW